MWTAALGDEHKLTASWRQAQPFPHLVVDNLVDESAFASLFEIIEDEAVSDYASDIFSFEATAPVATCSTFVQLGVGFANQLSPILSRITGHDVSRVDMRAFAYRAGHYLLPHTDHQEQLGRVLAYAFYLPSPDPAVGGELQLYRCAISGDDITSCELEISYAPKSNRLIVFEVGPGSLHQVAEVLSGSRLSLAGWFYR
jgi:Rps23 Pro-64 3,4-dihydroxylase Tpa1-like proline 4-hydroxylase